MATRTTRDWDPRNQSSFRRKFVENDERANDSQDTLEQQKQNLSAYYQYEKKHRAHHPANPMRSSTEVHNRRIAREAEEQTTRLARETRRAVRQNRRGNFVVTLSPQEIAAMEQQLRNRSRTL